MRPKRRVALAAIAATIWTAVASAASAQAPTPPSGQTPAPAVPPARTPDRFRLVLNACYWPQALSFSDSRTLTEFAEQTTISTSYEGGTGFGPDLAVQVSLHRGLGVLVGYSYVSRDQTSHVDVSRPHPL